MVEATLLIYLKVIFSDVQNNPSVSLHSECKSRPDKPLLVGATHIYLGLFEFTVSVFAWLKHEIVPIRVERKSTGV